MRSAARFLLPSALFVAGCGLAHDTVVTSYHVVTAPVRLAHHQLNKPPQTTTTTTTQTTTTPDVTDGRGPVQQATPAPVHQPVAKASPSPSPRKSIARTTPKPAASPTSTPAALSFPTAKPVPDKSGYVYSPDDASKYVDVSGYAPGSKVKDPYSGKIFLVP